MTFCVWRGNLPFEPVPPPPLFCSPQMPLLWTVIKKPRAKEMCSRSEFGTPIQCQALLPNIAESDSFMGSVAEGSSYGYDGAV